MSTLPTRLLTFAPFTAFLALTACQSARPDSAAPPPPSPALAAADTASPLAEKAAPRGTENAAPTRIVISGVGDCTLSSEFHSGEAPGSFPDELKAHGGDMTWFFSGVAGVLARDDLTIANLETTLTNTPHPFGDGEHHFRGKPEYTAMLKAGSVEVVNVANNHSHDFGESGYAETAEVVKAAGIGVAGNAHVDRRMVKGVEVVNLGFTGGDPVILPRVRKKVAELKTDKNLVVVSFHWGAEGLNDANEVQRRLGHAAVEAGADLVLGTHPHVLQGIEEYKGRHIVYSLGNFVFGGNSNPKDKDSIIYQEAFEERDGHMVPSGNEIIPVRISSVTTRNDYRPVLLEGDEKDRVLARVQKYSDALGPKRVAKR